MTTRRHRCLVASVAALVACGDSTAGSGADSGAGDPTGEGTERTTTGSSTSSAETTEADEVDADGTTEAPRLDVLTNHETGIGMPDLPPGTEPYGPCFEILAEPDLWPPDVCPEANTCNLWGQHHPDNCYDLGKCSYDCGLDTDCPIPATGDAMIECESGYCRLFCDCETVCPDDMLCVVSPFTPEDRAECAWVQQCDPENEPDVPTPLCPM